MLNKIDICAEMPPAINNKSFESYKKLFSKYNLVAIDPLIAFFDGDENSNSQARSFMNLLNKLAEQNNQAILITHHSTKGSKKEPSRSMEDSTFAVSMRLAYELNFIDSNNNNYIILKIIKDNLGIKDYLSWENNENKT